MITLVNVQGKKKKKASFATYPMVYMVDYNPIKPGRL